MLSIIPILLVIILMIIISYFTLQFKHWKFKIKVLLFFVFVKLSDPHSFVQNGILRL